MADQDKWHQRFKQMKKDLGLTNQDLAEITGNTAASIKTTTQPGKDLPRWVRLAIVIHEMHNSPENIIDVERPKYGNQ